MLRIGVRRVLRPAMQPRQHYALSALQPPTSSQDRSSTPALMPLAKEYPSTTLAFARHFATSNAKNTPLAQADAAAAKKKIQAARRRRTKIKAQEKKLESALEKGGERRLIRVDDLENDIPRLSERALGFAKRTPEMAMNGVRTVAHALSLIVTDPPRVKAWLIKQKEMIKKEARHYWLGSKLLWADVTTCSRIVRRLLQGHVISRRERKQLRRTVVDLLRLIPFSFFLIVPFMEALLPVALKLFPNMLPSTFKDAYQREEDMKRQLQLRVSLAEFMQETVKEVMQDTRDSDSVPEERRATAKEVVSFVERAQKGEVLSADETLKIAKLFNDELMLDNISRPQLVGLCRFMGIQPYGNDSILRFQLRNRVRQLKNDDQDIIWEGLEDLNKEELRQACMERGMRATGLTKAGYLRQMRQWLDLSINKNVPASLLLMSRAFNITASTESVEEMLATSMSSLDEELVTEVALSAPSSKEESRELRERRLENIRYQNEMIADEEKFREEGKKKEDGEDAQAEEEVTSVAMDGSAEDAPEITSVEEKTEESKSIENIVTLEELSTLESLASKSIVSRERAALDQLLKSKTEMDVEEQLAAGRIGAKMARRESKTASRMMQRLEQMLSKLEVDLDKVDKDVGDRLNVLDRDSDGVLSAEELRDAVLTIFRKRHEREDVEWLIAQLDEDNDGRISLKQLVEWIDQCKDILEVTGQIQPELSESLGGSNEEEGASKGSTLRRSSSKKSASKTE